MSGMWSGASIVVHLAANGVDETKTVDENAGFTFDMVVSDGESYSVTIDAQPAGHDCAITNDSGTVAGADVSDVDVACTGPAVDLQLSLPVSFAFDADTTDYNVDTSVLAQGVALTVTAPAATAITLDGSTSMSTGVPSAVIALPLAASSHTVEVEVGPAARTYTVHFDRGAAAFGQYTYVKASNTNAFDAFATDVAVSGDTIVVGAPAEASAASGVDGDQTDNTLAGSGAAYVFRRVGDAWLQEAYLKASNPGQNDGFGASVAIDGDLIAIGASGEDSNARIINGNQADNSAANAGAVYVFKRTGSTWAQEAYIKPSNLDAGDGFGVKVALNSQRLAVSALYEDAAGTGVTADPINNAASNSGAAYLFQRNGVIWTQEAYIKATNTEANDFFGWSLSLSSDTLVVGAIQEASNATGINGTQSNNSAAAAGAGYVYRLNGSTWAPEAYLKASNTGAGDWFGMAVAISGDSLVVGAGSEDSNATGIGGNAADNSAADSGAAYVFHRTGTTWTQEAYLKASNTGTGDGFGSFLALNGDELVVGAWDEASSATGIDGDGSNNNAGESGAAYRYRRSGATWQFGNYIKASNTGGDFGWSVALSGDTLVIGARYESSNAVGVNGDQSNTNAADSGAAYVFR